MTFPPPSAIVDVDVPITRRRRLHTVYALDGTALFSVATIGDLLSWLSDNDHSTVKVVDGSNEFLLTVGLAITPD